MANRPKGFGMTAELQDKKAAKFEEDRTQEAITWMEEVVGDEPFGGDSSHDGFHEGLKDGVYLCKLVNKIKELTGESKKKVNNSKMAFKQMENIGIFLDYCTDLGVLKSDLFQTVDLYEAQNIPLVVDGIYAFARKVSKKCPDDFPPLGPKEADKNKREFTKEQLDEGKKVIGLQMGTNTGASQAGMSFGKTRDIH